MMAENVNNKTKDSFIHILASEFVGEILRLFTSFFKGATKAQVKTIDINIPSWFRVWNKRKICGV